MITARLIRSGYCDAATNMAIDEAIFLSYKEGVSIPALRLYGWKPAAISLGYSQNADELIDMDACRKERISVVRRPTGGGIIFHDREVTYSIVLSQSDIGISYRVKESYEIITSFLLEAYKTIGLAVSFAKDTSQAPIAGRIIAPFCFARNESYDILTKGKKLGGNAQKRRRSIILQHGSIPLWFDKKRAAGFLRDPSLAEDLDTAAINDVAKERVDFEKLSNILCCAFSFHFITMLKTTDLSSEEKRLSEELKRAKYLNHDWNAHADSAPARVA